MFGIGILGIAVTVLQIADLGWQSVSKLFDFVKRSEVAAENIDIMSKENLRQQRALPTHLSEQLDKGQSSAALARAAFWYPRTRADLQQYRSSRRR